MTADYEEGAKRVIQEIKEKQERRWNPDVKGKQHVVVLGIWEKLLKEYFGEKTTQEIADDERFKYATSLKRIMYRALEKRCKQEGHDVAYPTLRRILNTHTNAKEFFDEIDKKRKF